MRVTTEQGDSVDSLCWRHLGSSSAVAFVLELNPGLAAHGPLLPAGISVTLPDEFPDSTTKSTINLWD